MAVWDKNGEKLDVTQINNNNQYAIGNSAPSISDFNRLINGVVFLNNISGGALPAGNGMLVRQAGELKFLDFISPTSTNSILGLIPDTFNLNCQQATIIAQSKFDITTPSLTWNAKKLATEEFVNTKTVLINNLTTSTAGQGALDARQGYLLNTTKQEMLISGSNIKTINGTSLLGSGDIKVSGGGGSRSSTIVIAPHNSSGSSQSQADYVLTGNADEEIIYQAINSIASQNIGGEICILEGDVLISDSLRIAYKRDITIRGQGKGTVFCRRVESEENIITVNDSTNIILKDFQIGSDFTYAVRPINGIVFVRCGNCAIENISDDVLSQFGYTFNTTIDVQKECYNIILKNNQFYNCDVSFQVRQTERCILSNNLGRRLIITECNDGIVNANHIMQMNVQACEHIVIISNSFRLDSQIADLGIEDCLTFYYVNQSIISGNTFREATNGININDSHDNSINSNIINVNLSGIILNSSNYNLVSINRIMAQEAVSDFGSNNLIINNH